MTERLEPGVYAALPDARGPLPWVLACHGSGRCAHSYRDVPFYARQREIALAAGCAFAACDLGPDAYGTPAGLNKLDKFYARMTAELPVRPRAALWGSSAGGCAMFRFASAYPGRVALLLGTFPVWDLQSVTHLGSMREAWGNLSGAALAEAVAPYNPAAHAQELPRVPIVLCHGTNDRAVPAAQNSLALARALGEGVRLFLTPDEHSTDAFGLYDTVLLAQALEDMAREGGD